MQFSIQEFKKVRRFHCKDTDESTMEARFREFNWMMKFLPDDGLFLEFGVYTGGTINKMSSLKPKTKFYGFDSFEGLPEDWKMGRKLVTTETFNLKGQMPKVNKNVKLIKGYFDDTLPKWWKKNKGDITFLHVDSDIYSSAKLIFDTLNKGIKPGTIIRFDELSDWRVVFNETNPLQRSLYTTWAEHEWKAMNEWMAKYNRKVMPICRHWHSSGTVVVTQ